MGKKQRTIILKLNQTYKEQNLKTDQNRVTFEGKKAGFEPVCVFTEEKPRFRFWRGAKNLILLVEGATKALRFGKAEDEIAPFWTQKEIKELVEKEMARALVEKKPMTMTQFIIILIPVLATLGTVLLIARRIGAI